MAGVSERSEMEANWYWGNALIVANSPIPGKPEVIQKRAWRGSTAMPPKPTSEASGGVHASFVDSSGIPRGLRTGAAFSRELVCARSHLERIKHESAASIRRTRKNPFSHQARRGAWRK